MTIWSCEIVEEHASVPKKDCAPNSTIVNTIRSTDRINEKYSSISYVQPSGLFIHLPII